MFKSTLLAAVALGIGFASTVSAQAATSNHMPSPCPPAFCKQLPVPPIPQLPPKKPGGPIY